MIKADGEVNSNKFWEAIQNNTVINCRWGRLGNSGQTKDFQFSSPEEAQRYVEKKKKEKIKEGYSELSTIESGVSSPVDVKEVARREIKSDADSLKLIDELVAWNVHNITSNSSLTVTSSGVQLPSGLGILSAAAIQEARLLLKEISSGQKKVKRAAADKKRIEKYLMLCPQVVDRGRGWIDNFLTSSEAIKSQESLLDSLEAAISTAQVTNDGKPTFETELNLLPNGDELHRIKLLFNKSRQASHDSYRFNMGRVFTVRVGPQALAYDGFMLHNEKELWHGTGVGNLLSILKCGLIIPKTPSHGRAYGDGIYFSDQTTKALNYAGGYWKGSQERRAFMFLAKVKMGKEYSPGGYGSGGYYGSNLPAPGSDSTFAKAGDSGVGNNEMIVYRLQQCKLTHLCEFIS